MKRRSFLASIIALPFLKPQLKAKTITSTQKPFSVMSYDGGKIIADPFAPEWPIGRALSSSKAGEYVTVELYDWSSLEK